MIASLILALAIAVAAAWLALRQQPSARIKEPRSVAKIEALLPQTQCQKCGYDGCLPYAQAIVRAGASTTLCAPGGEVTQRLLTDMLGTDAAPLVHELDEPARVALIEEGQCIGCTKCIQVCPVDAIVGAQHQMHTVLPQWCTGCELCIPVCPTDCITLVDPFVDRQQLRLNVPLTAASATPRS